jgi:hypothetical protein
VAVEVEVPLFPLPELPLLPLLPLPELPELPVSADRWLAAAR